MLSFCKGTPCRDMAAKNSVKEFVSDSFFHLYTRGVEKREVFLDEQDYNVFLSYLKTYVLPKDAEALRAILASPKIPWKMKDQALKLLRLNNFAEEIELLAYCLMPNHFHLMVKQKSFDAIDRFMNSLNTRYAIYFNKKYKRVGVLFQDVYKAVRVVSDEQLLHLSRYIHRNPLPILQGDPLQTYRYSSYPEYIGIRSTGWLKPQFIKDYFSVRKYRNSYKSFVEQTETNGWRTIEKYCIDFSEV